MEPRGRFRGSGGLLGQLDLKVVPPQVGQGLHGGQAADARGVPVQIHSGRDLEVCPRPVRDFRRDGQREQRRGGPGVRSGEHRQHQLLRPPGVAEVELHERADVRGRLCQGPPLDAPALELDLAERPAVRGGPRGPAPAPARHPEPHLPGDEQVERQDSRSGDDLQVQVQVRHHRPVQKQVKTHEHAPSLYSSNSNKRAPG
mmetsp:Transcript_814/g.2380  ORF Transcript_814/g.2380 Transcript_814/m.2380 type:complete len:201 (+) Transcript_814:409-1011(+)